MFAPAHVDGRTLVILNRIDRWFGTEFRIEACGELSHDGESLFLVGEGYRRFVTDDELAGVMNVDPDSKIEECRGFDLFLMLEPANAGSPSS